MRVLARIGAALGALTMLAACGFTPLYAEPGVAPGLTRVSVQTPDTREGFALREALEDALGWDRNQPALWRLETETEQRRVALGRRVDDTVSRYELILTVRYRLVPASGVGEPITDAVTAVTTYAAADQAYAGIAAQRDGEARVAAEAARLIRLDLSQALAGLEP